MLESMIPPNVETTLTINADGTYLLIQTFKEKQNEQESLRGTFQVLEGNMLMLALPSSGDIYSIGMITVFFVSSIKTSFLGSLRY